MNKPITYIADDGRRATLLPEQLVIEAGGPNAGAVWVRSPGQRGSYPMRPASEREVRIAEANIAGLQSAREACEVLRSVEWRQAGRKITR